MLNAFLCSQIYDVPLVWTPNTENGPFECDNFLKRHDTISSSSSDCKHQEWPFPFTNWKTFRTNHVPLQKKALLTMTVPPIDGTLYCGRMERPILSASFASNPTLPSRTKQRIRTIFKHGRYRAYGNAFNHLFDFKENVSFVPDIGLHIRTKNPQVSFANADTRAHVRNLILQHQSGNCVLFFAADHFEHGLAFVKQLKTTCTIHSLPRVRDARRAVMGAHGTYKDLFLREILHISHAKVVISIAGSSASELISSLAVANRNLAYSCASSGCEILK